MIFLQRSGRSSVSREKRNMGLGQRCQGLSVQRMKTLSRKEKKKKAVERTGRGEGCVPGGTRWFLAMSSNLILVFTFSLWSRDPL